MASGPFKCHFGGCACARVVCADRLDDNLTHPTSGVVHNFSHVNFYQPGKSSAPLILTLLYDFHICLFVCLFVCASAFTMCAIINASRTLLPCYFTLVALTTAESTGVATTSSLAQLQVRDTEEQRQPECRCDDARLTGSINVRSEQLLVMPTNRAQLTD